MDWEDIHQFGEEDIATRLQSTPELASAVSLREQYFDACHVLDTSRQPAIPYPMIGRLFRVSTANVRGHNK
jgi:hypothetical protein